MIVRNLILNKINFPKKLNKLDVSIPQGVKKLDYIEKKIIQSINSYNPKLKIVKIIYDNLEEQFSNVKNSIYTGAIVEDFEINEDKCAEYSSSKYFIFRTGDKTYVRQIVEYVYISHIDESGRNLFVSQIIFPTLLDYMEENIASPSYTISDHKFMFINIINSQINATMILRHIANMTLIGIEYVEVFSKSLNIKDIPLDLLKFHEKYDPDYSSHYLSSSSIYETSHYKIDFLSKSFVVKTENLVSQISLEGGNYRFRGSGEKFYWTETFPIIIFAYGLGFKIDYSQYNNFCEEYKTLFLEKNLKFKRCITLLNYLKKYIIN